MKKLYEVPFVEVTEFVQEDIITTSFVGFADSFEEGDNEDLGDY